MKEPPLGYDEFNGYPAPSSQGIEGWKLVPVEPTKEMLDACSPTPAQWDKNDISKGVRELAHDLRKLDYIAMLSTAPEPPLMRPHGGIAACYDCNLPYGDEFGFPDLVLPNDVWAKISPTKNEGGLLCPSCICKKLHDAGIRTTAEFRSGPLVAPEPPASSLVHSNVQGSGAVIDPMCQWQPIETASKDGTFIDVWAVNPAGWRFAAVRWFDPEVEIGAVTGFAWRNWQHVPVIDHADAVPTHWMPFPPAPGTDDRTNASQAQSGSLNQTSLGNSIRREFEELKTLALSAAVEAEREAITKWHDEQAADLEQAHAKRDVLGKTPPIASHMKLAASWHRECAAAIRSRGQGGE